MRSWCSGCQGFGPAQGSRRLMTRPQCRLTGAELIVFAIKQQRDFRDAAQRPRGRGAAPGGVVVKGAGRAERFSASLQGPRCAVRRGP